MKRNVVYLTVNFVDGMDITSNPRMLQPTKASEAKNIDFSVPNQFSKRKGYSALGTIGSSYVLGLYEFVTSGGMRYAMCAGSDGYIYKMDSLDGTWDEINPPNTTYTTDPTARYNFTTLAGKVVIVNGVDAPLIWTGGGDVSTCGGSPPGGSVVTNFFGYVWMNDTDTQPSYLYRSAYYNPESWNTSTDYYPIDANDGTKITALYGGKKVLYIWKEKSLHSLHVVDSNVNNPTFKRYRLFEIGCVSHKTVASTPYGLIWFDGEKVYLWDEQNYPKEISGEIRKDIASLAKSIVNRSVGLWIPSKNQYWLSVPYGTVSANNRIYVCTIDEGKFKWAWYDFGANDLALIQVSGEDCLYFASSSNDGYTYRALHTDADNGGAFTGVLKSKWFSPQDFGLSTERAYLDELQVTVSADGDWQVRVGYEVDFGTSGRDYPVSQFSGGYLIGSTYVIGVSPFGGGGDTVTDTKNFKGLSFKRIRFTFSNALAEQPFTIKELKIGVRPHNRR